MKSRFFIILALFMALPAMRALAGPDQFMGDSAIYSGDAVTLRPNILLLIDNSNVTLNAASGTKYDSTVDYCATYGACNYSRYSIYAAGQQGDFSTTSEIDNATSALEHQLCSNNSNIVTSTLTSSGTYVGSGTTDHPNLKKGTGANSGNLVCDTSPKGKTYALGNFLNYTQSSAVGTDTQQKVVYDAIATVVGGARYSVNFGAMVYGHNNSGGEVVYQIGDLSSDANFNAFLSALPGGNPGHAVLSSQTARPQAESLLDAGYYFWGLGLPISNQAAMPSPIIYSCGHNHVIIITNGLSNKDDSPQLGTIVGDYDHDGADAAAYGLGTHYLDDVAKYVYEHPTSPGQRIQTSTILAFQADDPLVERAADSAHGRGNYYIVANANELAKALTQEISNIVLETDTSFVAPVVPVSPENRTYSGSRVYMGFFKPISQSYWHGNLKKYGLSSQNALTDKNANLATYTDLDSDGRDDVDGAILPSGAINGSFRGTSISFWTPGSTADAGAVESGGAGKVLLDRNFTSSPRTICSNIVSTFPATLTDSGNAFTTANTALTSTLLGVDSSERDNLINFMHGIDTYDENGNNNKSEKRPWIFGDILHSRPLIVNYKTYPFTSANESDCSVNGSYVYVGGNDGMLHAIKDCDGSEAWAFIPQGMLGNLNYMTGTAHTYFVDSTPSVYIYDANNNGNITGGDKVILVFGERRGGGKDAAPTSGAYYALDVSDPTTPILMWEIDSQTTGFGEVAETWSEPKIVKMKIGGTEKIVAFVGAGYDNIHEDTRYGNTQSFTDAASVDISDIGNGNTVSGGSTPATGLTNPRGRGIYAIEIATLNSGVPNFTNSGGKIWGYTYADNSDLKYSIPSEITALDTDNNGYADRLYVGDTGGQIWRFDVGASSTSGWGAKRIFNLSAGQGRKFFYKPSVVMEPGYAMLFIGSGDREHPLNRDTNQVDRFYALKDKGQVTSDNLDESSLTDVTGDELQMTDSTSTISSILSSLNSSYGWFIRLPNPGEKVLAAPTVFNKVAYFTTYAPNTTSTDPCNPGNLGVSRLYAVDYKTGEAVLNYNTTNDSPLTPITNLRATSTPGQVLQTSDRSKTIGSGIPSGIVMLISPGGELKALIGVGGVIAGESPKKGGSIKPLYWRQK